MASSEQPNLVCVNKALESTLESVDQAEESVITVAQEMGFPEEDVFRLGMAVREAMVNAVVHGNRYNANKRVYLAVCKSAAGVEVRIGDEGSGVHLEAIPDPLADENLLKQSGRGMMLIRAFVDSFDVQPRQPAGTLVTLTKRLPPAA